MKIFYINLMEQNAGWGAECFVNKGFLLNGDITYVLDYKINRFKWVQKYLSLPEFDCLFLQYGMEFPLELIKLVNRPKFFWASELVSRRKDQYYLLQSKLFDHIFFHSSECRQTAVRNNWIDFENSSVLLNGFDESVQYKIQDIKKDIDILFVGNILPRRRRILDELKKDFNITETSAYGKDMTLLFNRAKIILNIHAEDFLDTETRIYEALGCGGFVISEKLSNDNPFLPDKHFIETDSIFQIKGKIEYYLTHEKERQEISDEGHMEAYEKHRYTIRAKEISDIFKRYISKNYKAAIEVKKINSFRKKEFILKVIFNLKNIFRPIKNKIINFLKGKK